jgi:signal transduction histidine kinase
MASITTPSSYQSSRDFSKIWNDLTAPAESLSTGQQQKAKLLAVVTLGFIPLSGFAIFSNPVATFMQGGEFAMPAFYLLIAWGLAIGSYVLSRTRYYWWGALLIIALPYLAVSASVIMTEAEALNPIALFYLSISVTLAGLLLSARETLIAGAIAVANIMVILAITPTAETVSNIPIISFVIVVAGITALVSDIRDRNLVALEASQEELKQQIIETQEARDRAEHSDKVKSAFLASMSHELRTPLNAIINFTRFVAKGSLGEVNEEQVETLDEVVDSARHLLNLINDVLDMSKIEAGSLKLFVEEGVDLQPILATVVATGKSFTAEKPVEIQVEVDDDLAAIRGDRQRILQILLNIMSNACKFTEEGVINVRAYQTGDEVIFSITDTGPGIALENQELVFEAFKQTATGLRQGGGTGLGMPISKSLAEAHGGRIWLESDPGNGAAFYVALPVKSDALTLSLTA